MHKLTILVWRLGALGDTLLLLPALAALRAASPNGEIVAAGAPAALAPALWSGIADRVVDAAGARFSALVVGQTPAPGALPDPCDVAVVWSARHAEIARGLAQAGVRRVLAAPPLPADRVPVATYYLAALAPLGVSAVPFVLRPPAGAIAATERTWAVATGQAAGPVALLHPGAGSPLKRWPLARYLALARRLRRDGVAVAWTAGPAEDDVRADLKSAGEGDKLLPHLDLAGLCAVLSRAAVLVSGDCGVAHLAALLGVPTVTLFGPTDGRVWGPPSELTTVLRLALPCSPCGDVARHCPSRICLRGLPVEAVHAATRRQIALQEREREGDAGTSGGGTDRRRALRRPAECHPPAPAPGPPGALQVSSWANGRSWGVEPSPGPE